MTYRLSQIGGQSITDIPAFVGDISRADAAVLTAFGRDAQHVLEFGVGGSTLILSQISSLLTIDTEQHWIDLVRERAAALEIRQPAYRLYSDLDSCDGPFQLIFDDGVTELREEFAWKTWGKLENGGWLLVHDTTTPVELEWVMRFCSKHHQEIDAVLVNYSGSNITAIRKNPIRQYENWNEAEGRSRWEWGAEESKLPENASAVILAKNAAWLATH